MKKKLDDIVSLKLDSDINLSKNETEDDTYDGSGSVTMIEEDSDEADDDTITVIEMDSHGNDVDFY